MSDRIDTAGITARRPMPAAAPAGSTPARTGSWNGERVTLQPDALALLADAKEELTFLHSEKLEEKKVAERRIEEPNLDMVERVQEIQRMLDQVNDLDPQQLDTIAAELRASNASGSGMLEQVRERCGGEPSHAYVALEKLLADAERDGDTDLAARTRIARDALLAQDGAAIRAGLNVTRAAMEAAGGDRKAAAELRDGYRDAVFGNPGPAAVYKGILERFGTEGFEARLRFLTHAAGDELAALDSSVERGRLGGLLADLSALRKLDTVHERCGDLCRRVDVVAGTAIKPVDVMRSLLPLTEEVVSGPSKLLAIPAAVGVPPARLDAQILFLRETREVLTLMPPSVYRDLDSRFDVLRGLQDAMDRLIEREEAGE